MYLKIQKMYMKYRKQRSDYNFQSTVPSIAVQKSP